VSHRTHAGKPPEAIGVTDFGPLFDAEWYLARNPDVAANGQDPLEHYLAHGVAERRDPNPFFDTSWYLAQNPRHPVDGMGSGGPRVADQRVAELTSELSEALRQRDRARSDRDELIASTSWRLTQPLRECAAHLSPRARRYLRRVLKAAWWAATPWKARPRIQWLLQRSRLQRHASTAPSTAPNAEARAEPDHSSLGPLNHYLALGAAEGWDPHPLFDTDWYRARNPDVSEAGLNPLAHFLAVGASQGRAPHPIFDADWSLIKASAPQIILPDPRLVSRPSAPLVSVIVPVFNKARYLRDCLSSILSQSLSNIEIICIDDCSQDESPAILREFADTDPRVFLARTVTRSGAATSRNAGIQLANGHFVQFTDADDVLPKDALRTLHNLAVTDHVPIVRGNVKSFHGVPDAGDFNTNERDHQLCPERHRVAFEDEPHLWIPWWHTTYLIDLAFLRKTKACYPDLTNGEDPVFIAMLLPEAGIISTTPETTYLYRSADSPRRMTLMHAIDFVRHCAMVRGLWIDRYPKCWRDGYRRFLLGNQDELFLHSGSRSQQERDVIKLAMMHASVGAYLPLRLREPWPEARGHENDAYENSGTTDCWNGVSSKLGPWDRSPRYEAAKRNEMLSLIAPGEFKRALELACAEGHMTTLLAERVTTLLATDISEVALERAAVRCRGQSNIRFQKLDFVHHAIPGEFDLIVCREILSYLGTIERLRTTMQTVLRALAPDGILVLEHLTAIGDDPDRSGFDTPARVLGARTIGDVVTDIGGVTLEHELRTPIYLIQRFRRTSPWRPAQPPVFSELCLAGPIDRNLERNIIWGGVVATRKHTLKRESASALPILMYHRIADSGPDGLGVCRTHPREFEQQIRWLRRRGYYSVSIDQWIDAMRTKRPLPGRPVLLTFDDGYRDFAEKAWPILDSHGFSALVFLVADQIGGFADWDASYGEPAPLMGWEEIRKLASEGAEFGSHALNHRKLDSIPIDQVHQECAGSRSLLEDGLGRPVSAFSYPWGAHSPHVRRVLSEAGYRAGVTTHPAASRFTDDPFALPRFDILGGYSLSDFARVVDRASRRAA
jgi:glycosyltransferase involved in cell wall biosynthesis/peptidoglycan/xylan/chitin deacetylase (PgdA/CDA1 family)/SAM-dependent methyltransferase